MARQSLYDYKKESILAAIRSLTQTGKIPSLREVADVVELPVSTLHAYVTRLRTEGLVDWTHRNHRSLKVLERPKVTISHPVVVMPPAPVPVVPVPVAHPGSAPVEVDDAVPVDVDAGF